jgi:hypothetical protein
MDNLVLPKGDTGRISRANMPQIDDADIPTLIVYLANLGVSVSAGMIDPNKVSAAQGINPTRAAQMPVKWLKTPSLISREPMVIDGNHRWYRHLVDKTMMPFIQFNEDFDTVLKHIFSFPQTYEDKAA